MEPCTRTRAWKAFGLAAFLCALAGGVAAWLTVSWRQVDPLGSYRDASKYERAEWHDDETASLLRRLGRLTRKREWSEDDAAFVRRLIETGPERIPRLSARALAVAPAGIRALAGAPPELTAEERALADPPLAPLPSPGDTAALRAWFASSPEGREIARWLDLQDAVVKAESLLWDRRRLGASIPESLERFALDRWAQMLEASDPVSRLAGAARLISGRFIEDPEIRVRVEALRLGDPDGLVRATLDQRLTMYDRHWRGVDPGGPIVECNTCP